MAFHPERLTGARARAYRRSLTWTASLLKESIPASVLKILRHPEHVKGIAQVRTKSGKMHRVAVVRNRVALLDHDYEEVSRVFAMLGDHDPWEDCRCRDTREIYATFTRHSADSCKKIQGRTPAYAENLDDINENLLQLRMKCREPKRAYRGVKSGQGRGRRKLGTFPAKLHLAVPVPYKSDLRERWDVGLAPKLERLLTSNCFVPSVREFSFREARNTENAQIEIAPSEKLVLTLDLYSWYSRIFSQGIAPHKYLIPLAICKFLDRWLMVYLDLLKLPRPQPATGYPGSKTADYVRVETYAYDEVIKPRNPYSVTDEEWSAIANWERDHRVKIQKPDDLKNEDN